MAFFFKSSVQRIFLLLAAWCLQLGSSIEILDQINLRAGVLHAPPFASVTKGEDGDFQYEGLQIDLLQRLQSLAAAENVQLNVELSPSPISYGEAFDLVANDCESLPGSHTSVENCNQFDWIIADYYATGPRSNRAELSPSWLTTTVATAKRTSKSQGVLDVTTLKEAATLNAPVCVVDGTVFPTIITERLPDVNFVFCVDQDDCLDELQQENCLLYADDELQLRFRAAQTNGALQVTPESFNTQYIVWAWRFDMPGADQLKRYIYDSLAGMDELFAKYFQVNTCPVGAAGENCEKPCDPIFGEANEKGECICISTKYGGEDCSTVFEEDTNLVRDSFQIMGWVLLGINCALIIGFAVWMFWQRNSVQVKMSQPFFLCMILVGCLISTSTIGAMMQDDDGDYDQEVQACMAVPWLYSVGFCITFGSLFAKIRRVYAIFKSAAEHRQNKVTFLETLLITAGVLLVDVGILLAWTFVDPLMWERTVLRKDKFGEVLESEGHCTCEHWQWWISAIIVYHLILLAIGSYMCYVSRNIPTKFSEGKYVSISVISNLQIFAISVPILIILGNEDPEASFFIRAIIIFLNDFVIVTLIFGNLIYHVHFLAPKKDAEKVYDHVAAMSHMSHGIDDSGEDDDLDAGPTEREGSKEEVESEGNTGGVFSGTANRSNVANSMDDDSRYDDDDSRYDSD